MGECERIILEVTKSLYLKNLQRRKSKKKLDPGDKVKFLPYCENKVNVKSRHVTKFWFENFGGQEKEEKTLELLFKWKIIKKNY